MNGMHETAPSEHRVGVYKLRPVLNDARIECFGIDDDSPILGDLTLVGDFMPKDASSRPWKAPRFGDRWQPSRKVVGDLPVNPNDYPAIGMMVPTFSQRAVEALRDFLEANGEILPVDSEWGPGKYFAYNVTTVADVLDCEHSDIEWDITYRLQRTPMKERVRADNIHHYEFVEEKIRALSIFRLVEDSSWYYVTNRFVNRCNECRLIGFDFRKVWPIPRLKKGFLP